MTLYEQMIVLIYHLIVGQLFGLFYSFLSLCTLTCKSFSKTMIYLIYTIISTLIYYYFLFYLNGGQMNAYLFIIGSFSFYIYYSFFYEQLLPIFIYIKNLMKPIKKNSIWRKIESML